MGIAKNMKYKKVDTDITLKVYTLSILSRKLKLE